MRATRVCNVMIRGENVSIARHRCRVIFDTSRLTPSGALVRRAAAGCHGPPSGLTRRLAAVHYRIRHPEPVVPHRPATAALALLTCVAVPATAQHPDFSGAWALDSAGSAQRSVAATGDARFRIGDMGSGWGTTLTLAQQASRLLVQYEYFSTYDLQPPLSYIFALDGSASRNSIMIGHAATEEWSRAAWRGDTLVISTTMPAPGSSDGSPRTAAMRQALHLESASTLVIETTRVGMNGAPTRTSRSVYRRQ